MAWIKRNVFALLTAVLLVVAAAVVTVEARQKSTSGAVFTNHTTTQEAAAGWTETRSLNSYDLTLTFDPRDKRLTGQLQFAYANDEGQPMSELHFLLYANSFAKQGYGAVSAEDFDSAYPNGFSPGSIAIDGVTGDGTALKWAVTGEQQQVLRVKLPKTLAHGDTATVTIDYTVTIPNCYGRFGYGEDTFSLVNCHPILSVYDAGQWHDYPYYEMGDPFYSEVADYNATITAPAGYTLATTGLTARQEDGDRVVWTVNAPARRDFGFVASDHFRVESTEVDGVLVRSYWLAGDETTGRQALSTAAQSIELYNALYGAYPYGEFSVVQTDFYIGGMEYPGMVLIDSTLYQNYSSRPVLDLVVAHETAHQWWYAAVGNDEVELPWLDEGLTEFTTQVFFEKCRGESYRDVYRQQIDYLADYRQMDADTDDTRADLPSYRYDNATSYSAWVYDRTAAVLQALRAEVGDDAFFQGMRDYYTANRLGIADREALEDALEHATGRELTDWLTQELGQAQ